MRNERERPSSCSPPITTCRSQPPHCGHFGSQENNDSKVADPGVEPPTHSNGTKFKVRGPGVASWEAADSKRVLCRCVGHFSLFVGHHGAIKHLLTDRMDAKLRVFPVISQLGKLGPRPASKTCRTPLCRAQAAGAVSVRGAWTSPSPSPTRPSLWHDLRLPPRHSTKTLRCSGIWEDSFVPKRIVLCSRGTPEHWSF